MPQVRLSRISACLAITPDCVLPVALVLAWLSAWCVGSLDAQNGAADWRADWSVAEGFTLRRDASGFRFPTAIAFVPQPGRAPGDPLYFVTELQGAIKV